MVGKSDKVPESLDSEVIAAAETLLRICSGKDIVIAIAMVTGNATKTQYCAALTNLEKKEELVEFLESLPDMLDDNAVSVNLSGVVH